MKMPISTPYQSLKKLSPVVIIGFMLLVTACQQVAIIVESVPENTPANAPIYITGQFNYWDPGDGRYLLKRNKDGEYMVKLPRGFGTMEYRFTRGNWESEEGDICGQKVTPRQVELNYADTVRHTIRSWLDLGPTNCGQLTFVITELPRNTPINSSIYIASNWNEWNPVDTNFLLSKDTLGRYLITLPKKERSIDFKFTRGSWTSGEVDLFGNPIANRSYEIGKQDSIFLTINNWDDLVSPNAQYLTIMIDELPLNTPDDFNLYLASNLNSWNTKDNLFLFKQQADGHFYLRIKHTSIDTLLFKITRGDWLNVEGDEMGVKIPNRRFVFGTLDTLKLQIKSWEDIENKFN